MTRGNQQRPLQAERASVNRLDKEPSVKQTVNKVSKRQSDAAGDGVFFILFWGLMVSNRVTLSFTGIITTCRLEFALNAPS